MIEVKVVHDVVIDVNESNRVADVQVIVELPR